MSMDTSPAAFDRLDRDRRAWEVAEEISAPPILYRVTAEEMASTPPVRVRCAWCGAEHTPDSDMTMWDCCEERRAWAGRAA